ncbi:hypothetical protein C8Q77DRAFT_821533 [Trametes polyzona]|nr:hypothetical protein C8Q77DRAFT_821533 [Trametes polyzona]
MSINGEKTATPPRFSAAVTLPSVREFLRDAWSKRFLLGFAAVVPPANASVDAFCELLASLSVLPPRLRSVTDRCRRPGVVETRTRSRAPPLTRHTPRSQPSSPATGPGSAADGSAPVRRLASFRVISRLSNSCLPLGLAIQTTVRTKPVEGRPERHSGLPRRPRNARAII